MKILTDGVAQIFREGGASSFAFGLPFPAGQITNLSSLALLQNDKLLPLHTEAKAWWPDGSVRWSKCHTVVADSGPISTHLKGRPLESSHPAGGGASKNVTWIQSPKSQPDVGSPENVILTLLEEKLLVSIALKLESCPRPLPLLNKLVAVQSTPIGESHTISGFFENNGQKLFVQVLVDACEDTGEISIQLRLHNPHAAIHEGNRWDLGDAGSILIEECSLVFQLPGANAGVTLRDAAQKEGEVLAHNGAFCLAQLGSGGSHWQSPIHWGANRHTTVQSNGFRLGTKDEVITEGARAEPIAQLENKSFLIQVSLESFWQNFPLELSGSGETLRWKLFQRNTELQGGESKTWQFRLRTQSGNSSAESGLVGNAHFDTVNAGRAYDLFMQPTSIRYDPEYLNACQFMPHLAFSSEASALSNLIQLGLTGEQNFYEKREKTDVYGWRHYGELSADHEAAGSPDIPYFISHYNNQYDPLMGMTLQYLSTGDTAWLKLIQPLNRHIQDIDIYDTEQDKAEYNGGLFWHTDHYLPAETCTHRSHSKYHTEAYDGFLGGGGPGGQHCYTTGLALQYRLFCDEQAKQKVEQLCAWVRRFYNGSGSIAERTFRLITMDFKQYQWTNIGVKAPGYRYPLDRGTGNYLVALIDHYDLSENPELVREMGSVIRQTCHPHEDISSRGLDNVEDAWFYTVFLQAIVRYLLLKESNNDIDCDYWYARHSLLHYCAWMYENEGFYLDKPEILEFPNDTWCAQELRKANLFCYAYYFSEQEDLRFLNRAEEFYTYVATHLQHSSEVHYTRILALMMQNHGVRQKFLNRPRTPVPNQVVEYDSAPGHSPLQVVLTYLKDVISMLQCFSLKNEWRWIAVRFSRLLP